MKDEIIVIRFGRMGDFIVSLPALLHLRASNPQSKITLVTGFAKRTVFKNKLIFYSGSDQFPWVEIFRNKIFDDVIYVNGLGSFKSIQNIISSIAGANVKKVYYLSYFGEKGLKLFFKKLFLYVFSFACYTWKPEKMRIQNQSGSNLQAWECLNTVGFTGDIEHLIAGLVKLLKNRNNTRNVNPEIIDTNTNGRKIICVYPSSTFIHKRWSAEKFAELIRWIVSKNYTVVLIGHQGEYQVNESVLQMASCDHVVNLAGKTSFLDLIDLMDSVLMVIGNDGGLMHVAAMKGVPTITIMSGIFREKVWDPFGKTSSVIRFPTECSNCLNEYFCPNGTSRCVSEIGVETVKIHFNKLIRADFKS
jgi:hypothetical protein